MNSNRYAVLARKLVEGVAASSPLTGGDGAAECRCAISRAYYAAYNRAVDFLGMLGFKTLNSGKCHTDVQHVLNNCGDEDLRKVATELGTLYSERRRADYEMRQRASESLSQAQAMVGVSESCIARIESLVGDTHEWGEIAKGILDHIAIAQVAAVVRK